MTGRCWAITIDDTRLNTSLAFAAWLTFWPPRNDHHFPPTCSPSSSSSSSSSLTLFLPRSSRRFSPLLLLLFPRHFSFLCFAFLLSNASVPESGQSLRESSAARHYPLASFNPEESFRIVDRSKARHLWRRPWVKKIKTVPRCHRKPWTRIWRIPWNEQRISGSRCWDGRS